MNIIFEDREIIVCIKPVGILSQKDASGKTNMVEQLEEKCNSEIFPLHRLDREVGGIMVFAKTKFAAAKLSADIADHKFQKEYIAFIHSKPETASGEMRDLLFKDSSKNKTYVVKRERKGVKEAILEYTLIETFEIDGEEYSKVRVLLHTGRTHQIRVQFSTRKMPLAGDRKYGARDGFNQIGLWSYKISFKHPKTNKNLEFSAEPQINLH